MNLLKILPLFLIGCVTTPLNNNNPKDSSTTSSFEYVAKNLDRQVAYLEYEHINDVCFLLKDICDLKAFQNCLYRNSSNQKCQEMQQKICFKKHEKCIVDNFHRWESIKRARGF